MCVCQFGDENTAENTAAASEVAATSSSSWPRVVRGCSPALIDKQSVMVPSGGGEREKRGEERAEKSERRAPKWNYLINLKCTCNCFVS